MVSLEPLNYEDFMELDRSERKRITAQRKKQADAEWATIVDPEKVKKYGKDKLPQLIAEAKNVGYDPRFPNTNQTRNCWQNYIDYFRCQNIKGEDYGPCKIFKHRFMTLCPKTWTEKWDEQRENGTFPFEL